MRPIRLTRLHALGILFVLAVGGFMFTRGGSEEATQVLPSLTEDAEVDNVEDPTDESDTAVTDDGSDDDLTDEAEPLDVEALDDGAVDENGEPIDEELVEFDEPTATGIDPLTGRPTEGTSTTEGEELTDTSGDLDPLDDESDLPETDIPETDSDDGEIEFIDDGADNAGRNDLLNGDGDGGLVIVDGNGNPLNGDGDGPAAYVVVDGDGDGVRNDVDYNGGYLLGQNGVVGDNLGVQVFDAPELSDPEFDEPATEVTPEPTAEPEPEVPAAPLAERANIGAAEDRLAQWLATEDVAGARIGLSFPDGSVAFISAGTDEDGEPIDPNEEFLATSITKTATAAVIFDLISEGVFELDQQAPDLGAFPDFEHAGKMTIRQLLQHTSGLASYQSSPNWTQDADLDPIAALDLADDVPLEHSPGEERGYSNSGYLYLGMLAEQYTGTPYPELVNNLIIDPVGMTSTRLDDVPRAGWVGYSAGGLVSTIPDLLKWGSALYRQGSILEQPQLNAMLDVNNEHATGLGANVICPCGLQDGQIWYTSIGHDGGSVTLQHSPADDMIVAAKFSESFWTANLTQVEVHKLLREIRAIVAPA